MKRVLFIDRDGTIIEEPADFQVDSFGKLRLLPGVITYLGRIAAETDYELVMVSNQDGMGTASFPEEQFLPVQNFLIELLEREGIHFAEICIDRSFESEGKPTRKPGTGMLTEFMNGGFDLTNSFVIGDRPTDVELARNLGSKAIFVANPNFATPPPDSTIACVAREWKEIYEFLRTPSRTATLRRTTNETDISVDLNLDGSGISQIRTGLPFLDHMLEQLTKHAGLDLRLSASGDLHIDEHHTVEDVAITLGEAFSAALADKRGMERYGFTLPMDDCLAQVAIDFGGRNWIVWEAEFKREKIGEMPTEMFFHFFKSFTDHAKCNLNVKAEGINEHHKIEAIFKAFAKAVKMAVRKDVGTTSLPSTKWSL